ncbi:hypothetical protein WMF04_08865 [Sorangium sp. So ce260]|uniref:hypothetical protein n=1 Tax=Sorangium sp. So ce260 TaxID=3133291 RepID=UPI003F625ADE
MSQMRECMRFLSCLVAAIRAAGVPDAASGDRDRAARLMPVHLCRCCERRAIRGQPHPIAERERGALASSAEMSSTTAA